MILEKLLAMLAWLMLAAPLPPGARLSFPAVDFGRERTTLTFAVVGDQGIDGPAQRSVANLMASWGPALIITTGDNYYAAAGGEGALKYDESAGQYYCAFIYGALPGPRCPSGGSAIRNAFFPTLGNHDYAEAGLDNYLAYFALPGSGPGSSGNERHYEFREGPVHFFALNSNDGEPDGVSATSKQAEWLKAALAKSDAPWKVVYFHHPPYSSGPHQSSEWMRWPFAAWGADAVLSGHDHTYERVMVGGVPYFVNGLGGAARYSLGPPVAGSAVRYNAGWGAQKVTATPTTLTFEFIALSGEVIDRYTLVR